MVLNTTVCLSVAVRFLHTSRPHSDVGDYFIIFIGAYVYLIHLQWVLGVSYGGCVVGRVPMGYYIGSRCCYWGVVKN